MLSYGDSFGWAFRDPDWARKLLLQGLISLIPFVGVIATFGWVQQCLDNLRGGYQQLPEPGFPLGRGIQIWLPWVVLGFVIGLVAEILIGVGTAITTTATGYGSGGGSAVGVILIVLGYLVAVVLGLLITFMSPALFAAAYQGGMGAAFNYPAVLGRAFSNPGASLLAIVATFIAGLGAILCGIGVFLTYGYGMSIMAGLVTAFTTQGAGSPGYGPGGPGYGPAGPANAPGAGPGYGYRPGGPGYPPSAPQASPYGQQPPAPYGEQMPPAPPAYPQPGSYGQEPPAYGGQPSAPYPSTPSQPTSYPGPPAPPPAYPAPPQGYPAPPPGYAPQPPPPPAAPPAPNPGQQWGRGDDEPPPPPGQPPSR